MIGQQGFKKVSLHEKAFDLYLEGYSLREIAYILYGDDSRRYIKRVSDLIRYYRKKYMPEPWREYVRKPQILPHEYTKLVNELVNNRNVLEFKKKYKDKRYAVQLATHEQLIYYIFKRMGYKTNSPLLSTARYYHYKIFPLLWIRDGEKVLKVWRNSSKSSRLFSISHHSAVYIYALILGVLIIFGHIGRKADLDIIFRELLPESRKHYLHELYALYEAYAGQVLAKILMMSI